jgi:hypothetical protein
LKCYEIIAGELLTQASKTCERQFFRDLLSGLNVSQRAPGPGCSTAAGALLHSSLLLQRHLLSRMMMMVAFALILRRLH